MKQPLRLRLARNLVNVRYARSISQAELAKMSGLDRSYIGSIEQARRNVSVDTIDRIADALDVDAQSLLAAFDPSRR